MNPRLMSFDVFGTLISVRDSSYAAFERILADAGAPQIESGQHGSREFTGRRPDPQRGGLGERGVGRRLAQAQAIALRAP